MIDARDDDIRLLLRQSLEVELDAVRRRAVDSPRLDAVLFGECLAADELERTADVQCMGHAALLARRRRDDDRVLARTECLDEGLEPLGLDAVIIGDQDSHDVIPFCSVALLQSLLADTKKAPSARSRYLKMVTHHGIEP